MTRLAFSLPPSKIGKVTLGPRFMYCSDVRWNRSRGSTACKVGLPLSRTLG